MDDAYTSTGVTKASRTYISITYTYEDIHTELTDTARACLVNDTTEATRRSTEWSCSAKPGLSSYSAWIPKSGP